MKLAGFDFAIEPTHVDESFSADIPVEEVPELLAQRKARALKHKSSVSLVIAADTVVILEGEILNKPADESEAIAMLQRLSGKRHTVITGVCLIFQEIEVLFSEETEVYFRDLSLLEIQQYVSNAQPLDKAGAYGIQDSIGLTGVQRIEGDFYNVMGLPVQRLFVEMNLILSLVDMTG